MSARGGEVARGKLQFKVNDPLEDVSGEAIDGGIARAWSVPKKPPCRGSGEGLNESSGATNRDLKMARSVEAGLDGRVVR